MQQRQLRLGDILDDYCPRERRLTNHAVVAMVEQDVIRTRCTTCDAEHEYKHAKVPRQRRKAEASAVGQASPGAPKRVINEPPPSAIEPVTESDSSEAAGDAGKVNFEQQPLPALATDSEPESETDREVVEEGPVHRPLIRATLPRQEGRVPAPRQTPDFTIRQPSGRAARFRHQQQRGPQ